MTEYLLSVWDTAGSTPPDDIEVVFAAVDQFNAELQRKGVWVFAGGLNPPDSATVVQRKNGETTTTDGPYAETGQQLGGFWIIAVDDLDAAIAIAAEASEACRNPVEVRPFQGE